MKKQDAIRFYGSVQKLAQALGIERQAIYQWKDEVPRLRAFELERITGGRLKA